LQYDIKLFTVSSLCRQILIVEKHHGLSNLNYNKLIGILVLLFFTGFMSGFTVISISGFLDLFPNLETLAFARDTDINLPDEILRNTSGLENVDLNQSANNELPPLPASPDLQGTDCVSSIFQSNNKCFLTYENSTYGVKINYPSTWVRVIPYSDEKYTTVYSD
jgi:hypothetical protein